jgi:hypothetical protein
MQSVARLSVDSVSKKKDKRRYLNAKKLPYMDYLFAQYIGNSSNHK